MGLGTALAAGMAAYDTTTQNIKIEDRNQARFEQNSEIREENLNLAKTKSREYNSETNTKSRAIQAKNSLMVAEGQNRIYNEMEQYENSQGKQQQQSNEIEQVKTEMGDMKAQVLTQDTFNSIYTDLAETGKIQNLDKINTLLDSDPMFRNKIKGKLIEYNPTLKAHNDALMAKAAQAAKQMGGEPADYFPAMESMARNNILAFDSSNNKPIDITAIGTITGASQNVTQSLKDKAKTNINQSITRATNDYKGTMPEVSNEIGNATGGQVQPISGVTDIAPWHTKKDNASAPQDWRGKVPEQEIARRSAYGMSIPPDLQAVADANKELLKDGKEGYWAGASDEEVMEGLDNIMTQIESGKPMTKQMIARAKTGASSLETADMKNDYMKELDAAVNNAKVKDIHKNGATGNDMTFMQSVESDNLNNTGSKGDVFNKFEEISTQTGLVSEINGALDELQKMDGQVLSGHMATAMRNAMVKDTDFIDSIAELRVDDDSKAAIAEADKIRTQVYNSLKMNTKVGVMLAKYIKSISGAAVSDQEREFLVGIMSGAIDASPKGMAIALETFRDTMIESVGKTANNDFWNKMLPATTYKAKNMADQDTDYSSSIPEGVSFAKETLDKAWNGDTDKPGFWDKVWNKGKQDFNIENAPATPPNTNASQGGNSGGFFSRFLD